MEDGEIALYSGWGPHNTRNPGDQLCDNAAQILLTEAGLSATSKHRPVTEPWVNPVIIGGGTTLPGIFKDAVAPGLRSGDKKSFLFN